MKPLKLLKTLLLGTSIAAGSVISDTPEAIAFEEQEVNRQQFIAVAIPYNYKQYRLEIIEQIPGGKQCWQESDRTVSLLLDNFDYSGSCRRISNTNGYTLRVDGRDDRVARMDKIVQRDGQLQLIAFHKDPTQPDLVIGKTNGISDTQPLKVNFNPGWRITKRVHQGQTLNHVYISGSSVTANNTLTDGLSTASSINGTELIEMADRVYGEYVNPLLNNVASNSDTASNTDRFCQGMIAINESASKIQNVEVFADGTLVLNDRQKINIRPVLAQYGIDADKFLSEKGSTTIDFDNDGVAEKLTIRQPISRCK